MIGKIVKHIPIIRNRVYFYNIYKNDNNNFFKGETYGLHMDYICRNPIIAAVLRQLNVPVARTNMEVKKWKKKQE